MPPCLYLFFFFFFNDTATTEIYTLSLHDALPISGAPETATGSGRKLRRRITFARGGEADLVASGIQSADEGLRFVASIAGESAEVRSPVFGTHLVEPLLAALGGALALGLGLQQAARGLSRLRRTGL